MKSSFIPVHCLEEFKIISHIPGFRTDTLKGMLAFLNRFIWVLLKRYGAFEQQADGRFIVTEKSLRWLKKAIARGEVKIQMALDWASGYISKWWSQDGKVACSRKTLLKIRCTFVAWGLFKVDPSAFGPVPGGPAKKTPSPHIGNINLDLVFKTIAILEGALLAQGLEWQHFKGATEALDAVVTPNDVTNQILKKHTVAEKPRGNKLMPAFGNALVHVFRKLWRKMTDLPQGDRLYQSPPPTPPPCNPHLQEIEGLF